MRMKTKTVRRLYLVGGTIVLLAGSAFGLFVVRGWMKSRTTQEMRAAGLAAVESADWYKALNDTGTYLKRVTPETALADAEANRAYSKARLNIEESDGTHLRDAAAFLSNYVLARPDDLKARVELMDLLLRIGKFPEVLDNASQARPKELAKTTAEHVPALRIEAQALFFSKQRGPKLDEVLARLAELEPLDIECATLRLDMLQSSGDRAAARQYAEDLLKQFPKDPRAKMIAAMSRIQLNSVDEAAVAARLLIDAAGLDEQAKRIAPAELPSAAVARSLIDVLDNPIISLHTHSLEVLREQAPKFDDIVLQRMLARRLWQEEQHDELLQRFGSLDPSSNRSDTELLGFVALSQLAKKDPAKAAAITATIKTREGSSRAKAWNAILAHAQRAADASMVNEIEQLKAAIRANPGEPILHYQLGEAFISLARTEEARAAWEAASKADAVGIIGVARGWPLPMLRRAETLLNEGRAVESARAALDAIRVAPAKVSTNLMFFETQAARLMVNSEEGPKPLVLLNQLEAIDQALAGMSDPIAADLRKRLVTSRIVFTARTGNIQRAKELAQQALDRAGDYDASTLRRLAAVSESERLGIQEQAIAVAEQKFGSTPEVLYARAVDLASRQRPEEAIALLRDAAKKDPKDLSAQIAYARFLEGRDNAASLEAWRTVLRGFSTDMFALRSVLGSPIVAQSKETIDEAVKAYEKLTGLSGNDDVVVKIATARSLLQNRPSRTDRDRAVGILAEIAQSIPTLLEPRVLLATALSMNDAAKGITPDYVRAVQELTAARSIDPRSSDILLELGRLEQLRGNLDRASEHLSQLATDNTIDIGYRRAAAELLVNQGSYAPVAVKTLEELDKTLGERTPAQMLLALGECYRALRQEDKARATFLRAAEVAQDVETVFSAARFFASRGELETSDKVLARLDTLDKRPWLRPLAQARILSERGDNTRAVESFEAIITQNPGEIELYRYLADHHLRRGSFPEAIATAERGLKVAQGDAPLTLLREQARLMQSPEADADLQPLIQALAGSPEHAQTREVLSVIQQARVRGDLNTPERLNAMVDRYPTSVPVMMFVARKLEPLDPAAAILIGQRAMKTNPADPAPAQLVAELNLRMGRWPDMLEAAQSWRERDRTPSPLPDLAIAEALLNVKQTTRALDTLKPHLRAASSNPSDPVSIGIINTNARILVASGNEAQARDFLRPLAQVSGSVRIFAWMNQAVRFVPGYELAQKWIDEVRPMIPQDDVDEQLQFASALITLAARFPAQAESINADANAVLKRLAENPKTATAAVYEGLAILRHRERKPADAEPLYRKALELDPNRTNALNNLADILAADNKLEEALVLAKKAAELAPGVPNHHDTMGSILGRIADAAWDAQDYAKARQAYTSAAAAFKKLTDLVPADHAPLTRYAYFCDRAGDNENAEWAYDRLLNMRSFPAVYHAGTKNNLALVLMRLSRNPADTSRALNLATDAVAAEPTNLAYRETLGWAQVSSGQRLQSMETFREVLAQIKEPRGAQRDLYLDATAGLARALSTGSTEERTEAKQLLTVLAGQKLPPSLNDRVEAIRAALIR